MLRLKEVSISNSFHELFFADGINFTFLMS